MRPTDETSGGAAPLDALLPPEMAAPGRGGRRPEVRHGRHHDLHARGPRRRLHRARRDLRDHRAGRSRRGPLGRPPRPGRRGIQRRPHPRRGRRGRALHREQPHRHGVGERSRVHVGAPAQLAHRLRRELRRGRSARPRSSISAGTHRGRRRRVRGDRARDRACQGPARLRAGGGARRALQCAGLPGRLADALRPHDGGPHAGHRAADQRLRGGGLRALRRQHVLRSAGPADHPPGPAVRRRGRRAGPLRQTLSWSAFLGRNLLP